MSLKYNSHEYKNHLQINMLKDDKIVYFPLVEIGKGNYILSGLGDHFELKDTQEEYYESNKNKKENDYSEQMGNIQSIFDDIEDEKLDNFEMHSLMSSSNMASKVTLRIKESNQNVIDSFNVIIYYF